MASMTASIGSTTSYLPPSAKSVTADDLYAALVNRPCPQCGCRNSTPIPIDDEANERTGRRQLPVLCCDQCGDVFGFDDATPETEIAGAVDSFASDHPPAPDEDPWRRDDDDDDHDHPRRGSDQDRPARRWHDDQRPSDEDHRRSGRRPGGRRGSGGGGCDDGRCCGGRTGGCGASGGYSRQTSGNGSASDLMTASMRVASDVVGKVMNKGMTEGCGGAARLLTNEMETVGQTVGKAFGSVAGDLIGSPRAAGIAGDIGATVGRGMAEIVRDSCLYPGNGRPH